MLTKIVFLFLLSIGFVQSIPTKGETCKAQVFDSSDACLNSASVPRSCKSATLDLGTTTFKTCTAVYLFWSYPMNNLTVTVVTPFTVQRQPYTITIDNSIIKDYSVGMYRLLNGQEINIKSTDDFIVQQSDSNYQIVLKFTAEPTISYYGFPLNYIVKKS